MSKILIVEDEKSISSFMVRVLQSAEYEAEVASDGASALAALERSPHDAMLLDLGLPDMDGLALLCRVRQRYNLPVIVVSARTEELDKVEALDNGADDYLTKPFGTSELLARIRTALRHRAPLFSSVPADSYEVDDLLIDYSKRRVTLGGEEIHLTVNEYRLVELLSRNPGKVLTYDFIGKAIWGTETRGNNQLLRVNMANIRRKLEKNPAEPHYICTEVGVGYRMLERE